MNQSRTRHDNYCPCCKEELGWDKLAKHVKGKPILITKPMTKEIVCPKCDASLMLEVCMDFALTFLGEFDDVE